MVEISTKVEDQYIDAVSELVTYVCEGDERLLELTFKAIDSYKGGSGLDKAKAAEAVMLRKVELIKEYIEGGYQ